MPSATAYGDAGAVHTNSLDGRSSIVASVLALMLCPMSACVPADVDTNKTAPITEAGHGGAGRAGSGGMAASVAGAAGLPLDPTPKPSCLDGLTSEGAGTFQFEAKVSGVTKLWAPKVPSGCKVPVIHFANGTGAACNNYQGVLEHLAKHGFLATCYENTATGNDMAGLTALQAAFQVYPDLADNKVGSAGHGQGGQGALITLLRAEREWGDGMRYAGLAVAPESGSGSQVPGDSWQEAYAAIKAPMFMFSGTADQLVSESWVGQAFDAMSDDVETYWYAAIDATHIPVPVAEIKQISIPWFRWQLLGDRTACELFKRLPAGERWELRKEQSSRPCDG